MPLDRAPIALHARTEAPDIITGVRIGITKGADRPLRFYEAQSPFLSGPKALNRGPR